MHALHHQSYSLCYLIQRENFQTEQNTRSVFKVVRNATDVLKIFSSLFRRVNHRVSRQTYSAFLNNCIETRVSVRKSLAQLSQLLISRLQ